MNKKKILTSILILVLISSGAFSYYTYVMKKQTPNTVAPVAATRPAPMFTKPSLNGDTISLANLKGKVIILDFFATWCPPCGAEIPHFIKISDTYKDKVQVIGISVDDSKDDVLPFIKEQKISYPIVMSEGQLDKLFGGITSIPTTYILDKDLNIIDKVIGYRDIEYFDAVIKQHL